eukprot:gb/GEZN01000244.1/.p1 GENE.gb/GEZN01000244.1/~~gb/GEZN01000244.1/.p1  ORF type:complete len:1614 (-),score=328.46 gb/GEZN01000244.1/:227-5068(-)
MGDYWCCPKTCWSIMPEVLRKTSVNGITPKKKVAHSHYNTTSMLHQKNNLDKPLLSSYKELQEEPWPSDQKQHFSPNYGATAFLEKGHFRSFTIDRGTVIHPDDAKLVSNYVITSLYTVFNFLPKNLFEQFQSVANLYFLCIGILQTIPQVSTTNNIPTQYEPLAFIILVSALRSAIEDRARHIADAKRNSYPYSVVRPSGLQQVLSGELSVGDIVKVKKDEMCPADMLFLGSSLAQGHCFIDKAALNGETTLEIKTSIKETRAVCQSEDSLRQWQSTLIYEAPNGVFDSFRGQLCMDGATLVLDGKVLLMREEVLRNTEYIYGLVVYTGDHTKIQMSTKESGTPTAKVSRIMRTVNHYLLWMLAFQCFLCMVGAVFCGISTLADKNAWYLDLEGEHAVALGFYAFWTWFILMSQLVPISLAVTGEFVKVGMTIWLQWDEELYSPEIDKPFKANNSCIHEDLGLVDYIFSDKTGTLTQNKMQFRYALVQGNHEYGSKMTEIARAVQKRKHDLLLREQQGSAYIKPLSQPWSQVVEALKTAQENPAAAAAAGISVNEFTEQERRAVLAVLYGSKPGYESSTAWETKKAALELYMRHMALSNTIEPYVMANGELKFQAESAEELAMVNFASSLGFVKKKQNPTILEIKLYDEHLQPTGDVLREEYRRVATFGFTSQRARVTLVYQRSSDNQIIVMCKGQDTVILPLLSKSDFPAHKRESLLLRLQQLSANGLRTLMVSHQQLPPQWWDQWANQYNTLVDQEVTDASTGHPTTCNGPACVKCKKHKLFGLIEREAKLTYIGCMGLEDQLQPLVPETIQDFLQAGIKVWMITGDKLEAAKNIGLACNLIDADMEPSIRAEDDVKEVMKAFSSSRLLQITGQWAGLTEDSQELAKLFDTFDVNGDGELQMEEISVFLEALDFSKTETIQTLHEGLQDQERVTKARFIEMMRSTRLTKYEAVKHDIEEGLKRYRRIKDHGAYPISMLVNRDAFHVLFAKANGFNRTSEGKSVSPQAMEYLRQQFFFLASVSKSVIFARAEPAMKKRMVTEIQTRCPKAVTLAVGDGANDTDMITAAHVGVGISGVEGTAAVNAADYAIGTFNMLHLLLLVHGSWCYDRITNMVYFIFYKACLLALSGYYSGFYSRFSGQQFYQDSIYNFYNVCLTAAPILVVAVLDQKNSRSTLQNNPLAYAEAKGRAFGGTGFLSWILRAIIHSLVCFFLPLYSVYDGMVGNKGTDGGLWYMTTVCYLVICLLPNFLIFFVTTTINGLTWFSVFGSLATIFTLFPLASLLPAVNPDLYGVFQQLVAQPQVWLITLLAVSVPFLLEMAYRGLQRDLRPTYAQILQERYLARRDKNHREDTKLNRLARAGSSLYVSSSPLVPPSEYEQQWKSRKHTPSKKRPEESVPPSPISLQEADKRKQFKMRVIGAMLRFRNLTGAQFDSAARSQYQTHDRYDPTPGDSSGTTPAGSLTLGSSPSSSALLASSRPAVYDSIGAPQLASSPHSLGRSSLLGSSATSPATSARAKPARQLDFLSLDAASGQRPGCEDGIESEDTREYSPKQGVGHGSSDRRDEVRGVSASGDRTRSTEGQQGSQMPLRMELSEQDTEQDDIEQTDLYSP